MVDELHAALSRPDAHNYKLLSEHWLMILNKLKLVLDAIKR